MSVPHLPATPGTTRWGRLPAEADVPVLTVSPGEQVTIDTVSHEGILEDQGRDPVAFFGRHGIGPAGVLPDAQDIAANAEHLPGGGPHVITGPIALRGARPGDWLVVRVDDLRLRAAYGIVSSRHGREPFLGIMGVTPRGPDRRHSTPPGEFGGNLDIRLLHSGSVLYLPVQVPGAGFYIGDPHYAQGEARSP